MKALLLVILLVSLPYSVVGQETKDKAAQRLKELLHPAANLNGIVKPQPDRVSLEDPTFAASLTAAMAPLYPMRTGLLPFIPINIPDPFENSRAIRLRNPPAELDLPLPTTPKLPAK